MGGLQTLEAPGRDPSTLGWPVTLPIEIALRTVPLAQLKDEYNYSDEEWAALRYDPVFLADLVTAVEMIRKDGMSFRMKARLQSEELLKTSWRMIHHDQTPHAVRADLIKSTMRWAGFEAEVKAGVGAAGNNLQININLG